MKVRLVIDGKPEHSLELSASDLASLVSSLADTDEYAPVYEALAGHPASAVRESVAYKDKLTKDVVDRLMDDSAINVVRNIVRSSGAREHASTDQLLKVIARDVEAAESIAGWIESYSNANIDKIATALLSHSDPKVRTAVANNSSTPKKHLKLLLKDRDPATRQAAESTLG